MTLALTVRTRYSDIGELVAHLAQRAEGETLVVAAASRMPKGEWVKFVVALSDGTPVLEGIGKVLASRERGANAKLHERFDLQLDSLQFDEKNEIMWERIQLAKDTDRNTGEIDVEKLQTQHDIKNPAGAAPRETPTPPAPRQSGPPPPPPPLPSGGASPPPLPRSSLLDDSGPAIVVPKPGAVRPSAPTAPAPQPVPSPLTTPATGSTHLLDPTDPSIRLPPDLAARIAELVPKLEPLAPSLSIDQVNQESVMHLALEIGIAALEAQFR